MEEVYLFSYFKGHGDGLHLAVSADGYQWQPLNHDDVFVRPRVGVEKIFRDPCVVRGKDGIFHLVWTSGWNEKGIGYASSHDLMHWSDQQYLPVMAHEEKARNCWAPEIFYYDKNDEYIIYWATTIDGRFPETQPYGDEGYNHRMYYVTTKDFRTFSETKLLYDNGFNVIDANIVKYDDRYLMFMKNETLVPVQKNIRLAIGTDPFSFGESGDPITPNHYWAEGPTALRLKDHWLVYFDKYKINKMGAVRSTDLVHWEDVSDELKFPDGAQHGYVSRVPSDAIREALHAFKLEKMLVP